MRQHRRQLVPRHLQVPWNVKDSLVVFLAAWIALPIVTVLLLRLTAGFDPVAQVFIDGLNQNNILASFALAIIDALGAAAILALYLRHYRVGWAAVGLRRFNLARAVAYLAAILVVFVVGSIVVLQLVSWLVPSFNANQPQQNEFLDAAAGHRMLALVALVIIPPVVEEMVFRGFVFPAIAVRWGVLPGAIFSSILFGFAHLQANVSIYTFLLGLLLCFMYTRLKSIVPGIALHMLNNYLAFLALTSK